MKDILNEKFQELKKNNKKAFIAFIVSGDPSLKKTEEIALELNKRGVDIIELGIPFSDPISDGVTIQHSSERALKNNVNIDDVLKMVRSLRKKIDTPIVFLTYYNLIYNYGLDNFVKDSAASGANGVVIPDLPHEESYSIVNIIKQYPFHLIRLIAPTTPEKRIKKITDSSSGFIYYVSLTGTTGERKTLEKKPLSKIKTIKKYTDIPVCVGFGISKNSQVKEVSRYADGVIVGSAIVKVIEKNLHKKDIAKKVGVFVSSLMH